MTPFPGPASIELTDEELNGLRFFTLQAENAVCRFTKAAVERFLEITGVEAKHTHMNRESPQVSSFSDLNLNCVVVEGSAVL
jgi:hypothetical protein